MENDIPALSDLLRYWFYDTFPELIVRGPDEWYSGFFYVDTGEFVWIADIDNITLDVTLRDKMSKKCGVLNAAAPDFFPKLEVHLRTRLDDIRESGGREHHH